MPDQFFGAMVDAMHKGPMPIPENPSISRLVRQVINVGWNKPFAVGIMLGFYYTSQDKMQIYYTFFTRFSHCIRHSQSLWGAGTFYALRGEYEIHFHALWDPYHHYLFPFICGLLFSEQILSSIYGFDFLPWDDCDQHARTIAIPYAAPRITAAFFGSIAPYTQRCRINDPVEQAAMLSGLVLAGYGYGWAQEDLPTMLLSWFIAINAFLFPEGNHAEMAAAIFTICFVIGLMHAAPFRDVITTENIESLLESWFPLESTPIPHHP